MTTAAAIAELPEGLYLLNVTAEPAAFAVRRLSLVDAEEAAVVDLTAAVEPYELPELVFRLAPYEATRVPLDGG